MKFYLKFESWLRKLLVVVLLVGLAGMEPRGFAQAAEPSQTVSPKDSGQVESKISTQEAEELFHSIDDILKFSSNDSGFPIKEVVKRRLTSRDEVVDYIQKH